MIIYVKNHLYNTVTLLSNYSSVTTDLEQLWICVDEENSRKKIFGLVYRPPAGAAETCLDQVHYNIECVRNDLNCKLTVLGDLNINYKNRNSAPFKLLLC